MIVVGLGSNQGDRVAHLQAAMVKLRQLIFRRGFKGSAIYESDAMLPEGAPPEWNMPFLNQCVTGETDLAPEAVLDRLQTIEFELGRGGHERWSPRDIDLDLVAYNDVSMHTERLQVPHPGLLSRPFMLLPLADLAPHWVHPDEGRTAADLAARWRSGAVPFQTRLYT